MEKDNKDNIKHCTFTLKGHINDLAEEDRGSGENIIEGDPDSYAYGYMRGANAAFRQLSIIMIMEHVDADIIYKATGLSLERINELKNMEVVDMARQLYKENFNVYPIMYPSYI